MRILNSFKRLESLENQIDITRQELFLEIKRVAEALGFEKLKENYDDLYEEDSMCYRANTDMIEFFHPERSDWDWNTHWHLKPEWFYLTDEQLVDVRKELEKEREEKANKNLEANLKKQIAEKENEIARLKKVLEEKHKGRGQK